MRYMRFEIKVVWRLLMLLFWLSACCGDIIAPTLNTPRSVEVDVNEEIQIDLDEIIVDTKAAFSDLQFNVTTKDEVQYSITDTIIRNCSYLFLN